jgi:opacity protein-like surface antigen
MKRLTILAVTLLASSVVCFAQAKVPAAAPAGSDLELKAGAFLGYTMAGDVNDKGAAFGGQVGVDLNKNLGVELTLTKFSDSDTGVDADITSIGLSGKVGFEVVDKVKVFAGGGISYTMFDMSTTYMDVVAASTGLSVEELAKQNGYTLSQARALESQRGWWGSFDVDNNIAFHMLVGASMRVSKNFEVFAQYTHTLAEMKSEITIHDDAGTAHRNVDNDYAFGVLKVGLNFVL